MEAEKVIQSSCEFLSYMLVLNLMLYAFNLVPIFISMFVGHVDFQLAQIILSILFVPKVSNVLFLFAFIWFRRAGSPRAALWCVIFFIAGVLLAAGGWVEGQTFWGVFVEFYLYPSITVYRAVWYVEAHRAAPEASPLTE